MLRRVSLLGLGRVPVWASSLSMVAFPSRSEVMAPVPVFRAHSRVQSHQVRFVRATGPTDSSVDHPSPSPSPKLPSITRTVPLRPWLETPVDLTKVSFDEAKELWEALGGPPEDLSPKDYVSQIAENAFRLAVSTLTSARTTDDLEETRSLLATAVVHGSDRAKLYCARLFQIGEWPISLEAQSTMNEGEIEDKRTAKEKGMEVIRQIRSIQKKRKNGERYDSKPPRDFKQSLDLLRDVANSAKDKAIRGEALIELGDAHFFPGDGDEEEDTVKLVSPREAVAAYEKAAKECEARGAWYRLGSAFMEGSESMYPDVAKAYRCFEMAVKLEDDPDAHFFLGHLLRDQKPDEAKNHLLRAATEHQHRQSMVYLARMALEQNDEKEAATRLIEAEKLGDPEAAHMLADAYLAGSMGFEKDRRRALRLYRIAGAAGSEEALLSAGAMHYDFEEYEDAFQCYEQAAEGMGSLEAWKRIAHLYLTGKGVAESQETAMRILDLVKKENDAQAHHQHGHSHDGVPCGHDHGHSHSGGHNGRKGGQ